MASTFTIPRPYLIYGLTLPLAVVLGIVLAEPLQSTSLAVVVMVFTVLGAPILIRYYHPFLVLSWNAAFYLGFLPGALPVWGLMAALAFIIALLNRCTGASVRLTAERRVSWSLIALGIVVIATALVSGGFGMRALGSETYGGRRYVSIALAILGYFALASRRIAPERAMWYAAMFFLPGMTAVLGDLIYMAGSRFSGLYVLYNVIPTGGAMGQAMAEQDVTGPGVVRIGGWSTTALFGGLFLIARYGIRGILEVNKPWRLGLMMTLMGAGMFAGFRTFLVYMGLVLLIAFLVEGLHRTRYALVALMLFALCGALLVPFAARLPPSVQRALSFLPVEISAAVRQDAQGSTNWRLEMWKRVWPEVPHYLLKGKGYALDPNEYLMALENTGRGYGYQAQTSAVAGDYHNGPLSVLIPFGLWGTLAFGWFLLVTARMMYRHCVKGDPSVAAVNRTLFACFVAKAVFFMLFFGSLHSDMAFFTGLAGLAVSLNGLPSEKGAPIE